MLTLFLMDDSGSEGLTFGILSASWITGVLLADNFSFSLSRSLCVCDEEEERLLLRFPL